MKPRTLQRGSRGAGASAITSAGVSHSTTLADLIADSYQPPTEYQVLYLCASHSCSAAVGCRAAGGCSCHWHCSFNSGRNWKLALELATELRLR